MLNYDKLMDKKKILNIDIHSLYLKDLLIRMKEGVLVTPNVDHLIKLQKDEDFYNVYLKADWVICDSKIVNHAANFIDKSFKEVIPGSSFLPAFCEFHKNNEQTRIFLLGAAEGVAKTAMLNINNRVGRNIVVGAHSPSFKFDKDEVECNHIIDIIKESNANVLVVGVGAPKQEKWIMKYKPMLKEIKLFMALGATLDFEAGNIKRAPVFFQKLSLEWLFRLISDPKRLWKRYLIDDMPFFFLILKQKLGLYKNPFEY